MKSSQPISKVEMIERSMSCFRLGLAGLVPLLGIPMAVMALSQYRKIQRGQAGRWNPAARYVKIGVVCARLGLWPMIIAVVIYTLIVYFG